MKLQYKHQKFQEDAAQAIVEIFYGQPQQDAFAYRMDVGKGKLDFTEGFRNYDLVLSDDKLTQNIRQVQISQDLQPIDKVQRDANGTLALSIEMETGTGKTYTYIKTMYELHKHYGWTKFIIVVPSVAIREGVIKSLETMADHFAEEYGERMQHFVYDSARLTAIDQFASDSKIHVMVINTQAFNATGAAARRISMKLEDFAWRKPIDVIAETHPILIIDEPQSVLGADKNNKTREGLKNFNPLFTLLYSATHRKDDIYNQVYRLDTIDAFNKRLVKKIEVMGVEQVGTTATNGYLYLDAIVLAKKKGGAPRARISFDATTKVGLRSATRIVDEGFDLYAESGEIEAYRNGYIIERIDGAKGCIRLSSGQEIYEGQAIGAITEDILRRIQIRTTIQKHFEREQQLYKQGIKVLSLFFIDAVEKYRIYETGGETRKGRWAEIFEEEYLSVYNETIQNLFIDKEYREYLDKISPERTHAGYFSQDKKGKMIDSKVKRGETASGDTDAYQLIMRDKERLLSFAEPTRFIFSHSALKEGWDNPNVFQICALKQSDSEIKKRQEVGRGMRLCVNQQGERQDSDLLGDGVYDTNILTVIANESYKDFSEALQKELAESITSRAMLVTEALFIGKTIGETQKISKSQAATIMEELISAGYVKEQKLTEKYFEDKKAGTIQLDKWQGEQDAIIKELDKVFNPKALKVDNGRGKETAKFKKEQFARKEFQNLWKRINSKTYYEVNFKTEELIQKAIARLNESLHVTEIHIAITAGTLANINSKEELEEGRAMQVGTTRNVKVSEAVSSGVRYDLIGELVQRTGLKRSTIATILTGIKPETFGMYRKNPEEFIIRASNIINEQKAIAVVEHITYHKMNQEYDVSIFSEQELRGRIGIDAIQSEKSLYDLVIVDSQGVEKHFAEELEQQDAVEVYTKLPRGFYINTPVGKYNPDWAIVFREGEVKHIYFVAETKGSEDITQLRAVEHAKIECASRHFASISDSKLKFGVVKNYETLYNKVMQD
ncbi:Restriction endonuclease subunit R [Candidatus Ornithobacterium hominis]|uniref:restriction endonuclease n=1 Tax=Candidatus Ornithobacterium hominis TaxID=2497989 RepID=UPI0024BC456A|nr:DEAD/DEAH box helicase family protein [Candidatus Ornithobacterium hominis]CAI9429554.1 Restriction endonuclease subunit R [Candidatus Ornithobacterium hominis]